MKYAILYSFQTATNSGTGRIFMTVKTPIDTEKRILEVESRLMAKNRNFTTCFITNLVPLKG